ncbi:MAG: ParB N-terminal domain-containing protein [Deltaproteobacteria bacterium]|nr:ParB N-terminal domain-containing protein [Deltaproteobacteria bacterium]
MTESNKTSRVDFSRIEVGVLGNVRFKLRKIPELVEDIKQRGLLENLVVWHKRMKREPHVLPDGREAWDRYILIAGHRRHEALRIIREEDPTAFETVPVTLFTGNEDDARFAMLAENLGRDDLTAAEVAESVYQMKLRGHAQAEIARRLAKSQTWVSRLLKFRENACEPLRTAVADDAVPFDLALTLCELDEGAQKRTLARYLDAKKTDGKAAAGKAARGEAGAIVRPSAKVLARELELITSARKSAPRDQQVVLSLAERVLSYALGRGPWPAELPRPEPPPKGTSKPKRS